MSAFGKSFLALMVIGLFLLSPSPTFASSHHGVQSTRTDSPAERVAPNRTSIATSGWPVIPAANITIPIAGANQPDSVAYDPANGDLYVVNPPNITIMSDTTNKVVGSIQGRFAGAIAFDPFNGDLYVPGGGNNVSVISGATNALISTVSTTNPANGGLAVDTANGNVFVACAIVNYSPCDVVSVISGATNSQVATVSVGTIPEAETFDPVNGEIYVSDTGEGVVSVISGSTNQVLATVWFPPGEHLDETVGGALVAAVPSGNVYVAVQNYSGPALAEISGSSNTVVASVLIGQLLEISGLAYDSSDGEIYVANAYPTAPPLTIFSVSNNTVVGSVDLGPPSGAQLGPDTYDTANQDIYLVNNNEGTSLVKEHNVTVVGQAIANFALTPALSPIGGTVYVNASTFGGLAPYSYTYKGLPGCPSENVSNLACTPTQAGLFNVTVTVADRNSMSITSYPAILDVTSVPIVALSTYRLSVDANESISFRADVVGGEPPYSYAYSPSTSSAKCGASSTAWLNCTPSPTLQGRTFNVSVQVRDHFGLVGSSISPDVRVYEPLKATLTISNATPLLDQTVAINANVSGGSPPYNYTYLGLPYGCYSVNSSSIGCLPTQAGWYNVTVAASDQNGGTISALTEMHVVFDFNVIAPSSTVVGTQLTIRVDVNEPFSGIADLGLGVRPAGGIGTLNYSYSGLPPGCAYGDKAAIKCVPSATGVYTVRVTVRDQVGDHQTHSVVVHVVNGFLGLPGEMGYYVLGGLIAVAAGVGIGYRYLRATRMSRIPPSEEDPRVAPYHCPLGAIEDAPSAEDLDKDELADLR